MVLIKMYGKISLLYQSLNFLEIFLCLFKYTNIKSILLLKYLLVSCYSNRFKFVKSR